MLCVTCPLRPLVTRVRECAKVVEEPSSVGTRATRVCPYNQEQQQAPSSQRRFLQFNQTDYRNFTIAQAHEEIVTSRIPN